MKLVTTAEMRQIVQKAAAQGWSPAQGIETAGQAIARLISEAYVKLSEHTILGLIGQGENGDTALAALAELQRMGWQATAYLAPSRPEDDQTRRLAHGGGWVLQAGKDPRQETLGHAIADHAILLDGLLGPEAAPPLSPPDAAILTAALHAVRAANAIIIAVDIPSGLNGDSGEAAEETMPADLTLTLAAAKIGMAHPKALELVGNVAAIDLGLPENLSAWGSIRRYWVESEMIVRLLPPRPAEAHKGQFGHVVIAAGSVNAAGAPLLAGAAAYRIGAGRVTLAVPSSLHTALAGRLPEAQWVLLPHELGIVTEEAADVLRTALAPETSALLLGPGLGEEPATAEFLARLLEARPAPRSALGFVPADEQTRPPAQTPLPPLVVEAEALRLLAQQPDWHKRLPAPAILLPRAGEMATLAGVSTEEVQTHRLALAEKYARARGHVLVLKGAGTIVAAPDGHTAVIPVATPALARTGSGDVLAGATAGLLAQGLSPWEAALTAAWLHAQAGLFAWQNVGTSAGVLASDIIGALPQVLQAIGYG